jgi:AraC-like DNA-binding protein
MQHEERKTKKQTFESLAQYFDLPIAKAAQMLGISETYLKRQCRVYNINRWPYRRIAALKSRLQLLNDREDRKEKDDEEMENIQTEIENIMENGLDNEGEAFRKVEKQQRTQRKQPTEALKNLDLCRKLIEEQALSCKHTTQECNLPSHQEAVHYVPYAPSSPSPIRHQEPSQYANTYKSSLDDYISMTIAQLPATLLDNYQPNSWEFPVVRVNWAEML